MVAATSIAIAALSLSAVGTIAGVVTSQKAAREQEKQFKASQEEARKGRDAEKQLADLQTVRAKRQAAREAQIRRAEIEASGEAQGVSGSSAVAGATGSVTTQGNSNVSFLDEANRLNQTASTAFGNARDIAAKPINVNNSFGQVATAVGSTLFSAYKGGLFDSADPTS